MERVGTRLLERLSTARWLRRARALASSSGPLRGMWLHVQDVAMPEDAGPMRRRTINVLNSGPFQIVMISIIVTNVVLMVMDTNSTAACVMSGIPDWETDCLKRDSVQFATDCAFLFVFAFELAMRLYAARLGAVSNLSGMLDTVVVLVGFVEVSMALTVMSSSSNGILRFVSLLRFLRVLRLMRAVRLLCFCEQLHYIVQGFTCALQTMSWGLLFILFLLTCVAIVAVEFIAPFQAARGGEPDWCVEAFSTVFSAMLFFFQITVAGDSWGECTIPIMQSHWITMVLFVGVFCMVDLVFVNLILSAIIQTAQESHEQRMMMRNEAVLSQKEKTVCELNEICVEIDADNSGTISLEELMEAYETNDRLGEILNLLDLGKHDLIHFFRYMDTDHQHEIDYQHFIHSMRRAFSQDLRIQMMSLKLQVHDLGRLTRKLQHRIVEQTASRVADAVVERLLQEPKVEASCNSGLGTKGCCGPGPPPGCGGGGGGAGGGNGGAGAASSNLGERIRRLAGLEQQQRGNGSASAVAAAQLLPLKSQSAASSSFPPRSLPPRSRTVSKSTLADGAAPSRGTSRPAITPITPPPPRLQTPPATLAAPALARGDVPGIGGRNGELDFGLSVVPAALPPPSDFGREKSWQEERTCDTTMSPGASFSLDGRQCRWQREMSPRDQRRARGAASTKAESRHLAGDAGGGAATAGSLVRRWACASLGPLAE